MPSPEDAPRRSWWRSASARRAGLVLGVALIGLALWRVSRDPSAWQRLADALHQPWHVAAVAACVVANLALAGWLFHRLYKPVASVGLGEMEVLIASSSLLNYLPAKAGLAGRALYHRAIHGVPLSVSVRLILLSAVGTVITSGALAAALLVLRSTQAVAAWIGGGALVLWVLPRAFGAGPMLRAFLESVAIRQLDLGVWCLRYLIVFAAIGIEIDLRHAGMAAASAMLIGLVPFLANGMGLREWAVALLGGVALPGGAVAWTEDAGLSADLLNRAIDLAVVVPLGTVATSWALRRLNAAVRTANERQAAHPRGCADCRAHS